MEMQWNSWIDFGMGLRLCLYDYALECSEELIPKKEVQSEFEIDFTLSGQVQVEVLQPQDGINDFSIRSGTNGLYYLPDMEEVETRLDVIEGMAPKGVLISGSAAKLGSYAKRYASGPPLPWEASNEQFTSFACEHHSTTPAMKMVLEQILYPPVEKGLESLYLEGKVLELIALQLSHRANSYNNRVRLTKEDRCKLFQARQILLSRLDNPPSIGELSRLSGINDFKLKAGFRQIFGDTVFHTLKTARMEKARRLFDETGESVLHIANQVGYSNPSHFAAAFRQCFGMTPRVYLSHRQFATE